jgi:hypothetical protein
MEGTRHAGNVVVPVGTKGLEERVKIIQSVIVEENLELRQSRMIMSLALILVQHRFNYVLNCNKSVRSNRTSHV